MIISVIIPVYNVEQYLKRCLDSIVNQTFEDYEIICVNDCSPDNSWKEIKKVAAENNNITGITKTAILKIKY